MPKRLAAVYAMRVLSFDPATKLVFFGDDGGSNGYDRAHNSAKRVRKDVAREEKHDFDAWWSSIS